MWMWLLKIELLILMGQVVVLPLIVFPHIYDLVGSRKSKRHGLVKPSEKP
jgi:hypothetical protein